MKDPPRMDGMAPPMLSIEEVNDEGLRRELTDLERQVEALLAQTRRMERANWWLRRAMGLNGALLIVASLMGPHFNVWLDLWCCLVGGAMLGYALREIYKERRG